MKRHGVIQVTVPVVGAASVASTRCPSIRNCFRPRYSNSSQTIVGFLMFQRTPTLPPDYLFTCLVGSRSVAERVLVPQSGRQFWLLLIKWQETLWALSLLPSLTSWPPLPTTTTFPTLHS